MGIVMMDGCGGGDGDCRCGPVEVALQPYLCVAMKSTVSSPHPGRAKKLSNQSSGARKQFSFGWQ